MKKENKISIRTARAEDIEALARLATQLGYSFTAEQIQDRFDRLHARPEEDVVIIAEVGDQVVGWVHAHTYSLLVDAPEVEIGGLVVDESTRGQGIGKQLMKAAESWARKQGYSSIYLRSNTIRTQAHEFYKQIGYEIIKSQYAFRKNLE